MIYDLHHRYLFIHIPRTAGVAITRALAGASSHCFVDLTAGRHATAAVLRRRLGDLWSRLRPFAIARSPWDIVLSDYRLILRGLRSGALQAPLAPGWRARLERMQDEPGFAAFVRREILDPRYGQIRGGDWRTWCTDTGQDLGVQAIRYEELADWPAVASKLGLPACELPRVNQTPDVETPVWTGDVIEAVRQACGDDVERFGWQPPTNALADVRMRRTGTVDCGPACEVVREGLRGNPDPYPDRLFVRFRGVSGFKQANRQPPASGLGHRCPAAPPTPNIRAPAQQERLGRGLLCR